MVRAVITVQRAAAPNHGWPAPLIGRHAARQLARHELAEMSFLQRIVADIERWLFASGKVVPGGWFGLIALAVLGVLAITVALAWARPGTPRRAPAPVLGGQARSAAEHRREAERLAAAGSFAAAIIEGVRSIAADLDEREILARRPGRTADELAAEAGRELPGQAAGLREVTRLFDDVRYGDRDGSRDGYDLVMRTATAVLAARPDAAADRGATGGELAVPR
ncbi:MAG TPA: DUF4129 domain-containing protein [Streptosporangiaceae bacterium]